jgi:hypothetical protein
VSIRAAGEFPTPAFRLVSALALVAAVVIADAVLILQGAENGWILPLVVGAVGLALVPFVVRGQSVPALIARLVVLLFSLGLAHVLAFWIWAGTVSWE